MCLAQSFGDGAMASLKAAGQRRVSRPDANSGDVWWKMWRPQDIHRLGELRQAKGIEDEVQ